MRIILNQDVPNLGSLGDEVTVKDGYARNFLLPRGFAMVASGRNAKAVAHRRHFLDQRRKEAIATASGTSEQVTGLQLVIKAKAGSGGRLFGSVTNRDLQALLSAQGVEVDRKSITLREAVKSLGTFVATVKLHTDVKVDITFRVESDGVIPVEPTLEGEEGEQAQGASSGAESAAAESSTGAADSGAAHAGDPVAEDDAAPGA